MMRKYLFFSVICLLFYNESLAQFKLLSAKKLSDYTQNVYSGLINKLSDSLNSKSFAAYSNQFNSIETEKAYGDGYGTYIGKYLLLPKGTNKHESFDKNNISGLKFYFKDTKITNSLSQITRIKILYHYKDFNSKDSIHDLAVIDAFHFLNLLTDEEKMIIYSCISYYIMDSKELFTSPIALDINNFNKFSYNIIYMNNIKFKNYVFSDLISSYSDSLLTFSTPVEVINSRYDNSECVWFRNYYLPCDSDVYMGLFYASKPYRLIAIQPSSCCNNNQIGLAWLPFKNATQNMLYYESDLINYYISKIIK